MNYSNKYIVHEYKSIMRYFKLIGSYQIHDIIFHLIADLHEKVWFYPGSVTNNIPFERRYFFGY